MSVQIGLVDVDVETNVIVEESRPSSRDKDLQYSNVHPDNRDVNVIDINVIAAGKKVPPPRNRSDRGNRSSFPNNQPPRIQCQLAANMI